MEKRRLRADEDGGGCPPLLSDTYYDWRKQPQVVPGEIYIRYKKKLFLSNCDQPLERSAQEGDEVSHPAVVQEASR